jgi:hypothetical protein
MKKVSFIFLLLGRVSVVLSFHLSESGRSVGLSVGKEKERKRVRLPFGSYQKAQVAMDGHYDERVAAERNWRLCA